MKVEQLTHNAQNISSAKDIEKAAKGFESFFIYYMLKVMRESVPKSGLMGSSMSEDVYTSLMDEKVAEGIASKGGLGLSDLMTRHMIKEHENKK